MIFLGQEDDLINTKPNDPYFTRVKQFITDWQNGLEYLEVKTSGSTKKAKTIRLSREQIVASVKQTKEVFQLDENTFFLCNLSLDYIAGKLMIIRALELKAELMVIKPEGEILENIGRFRYLIEVKRYHILFSFVPLQLTKLLKTQEGKSLLNLGKAVLVGGAAVGAALLEKIKDIAAPVYATFGMTETVTHFAIKQLNGDNPPEAFRVLNGTEIKLKNDGVLYVKNACTNHKWLKTNDLAAILDQNSFIPKGRADNVINSGGIKIDLDEIEQKIDSVLKLEAPFFCYGLNDEKLGQKLSLFIETQEKVEGVLNNLSHELPKFEVPKELIFVPRFLRTQTGKIDKRKTVDAFAISN